MKNRTAGTKKISPDGLTVARAYRPPGGTNQNWVLNATLKNVNRERVAKLAEERCYDGLG